MIELRNISKKFGKHLVLDNISFTVADGETLLILGPSGSGKSVILKNIIGILSPDSGGILIDDIDITKTSYKHLQQIRKKMAVIFQRSTLFDSLNVYKNMIFSLKYHNPKLDDDYLNKLVKEKLALVGLDNVEHLYPSELSGGMQKRISLARALMHEPKYIFFDEPTTGLDPIMSNVINELIKDINLKIKATSIIVTHDIEWAINLVDKVLIFYNTKIRFFGTTEEFKKSDNPYVIQFIDGRTNGPISTHLKSDE